MSVGNLTHRHRQFSPFSWWGSISLTLKPAELPTKCGPPPTLRLFRPGPVRDRCRPSRVGPNRLIGNEDPVYLQRDFRKAALQLMAIKPGGRRTTTVEKAGLGQRKCSNTDRCYSPR